MGISDCYMYTQEDVASCIFYYRSFHYIPSKMAAFATAGLFFIITAVSLWLTCKHRKSRYMWTVPLMGFCEAAGYGIRGAVAGGKPTVAMYVNHQLFILLAPIALACVNYIVVGRLLRATGEHVGCLKPQHIARLFLASDVFTFIIQSTGGALQATAEGNKSKADMGRDIILAGLIAQIVFFLAFFVLALYVGNSTRYGMYRMTQRKQILAGLFSTILLMLVRNVYRVLDKAVDETNPITADEWVFYAFETAPILLAFVAYCVWHFGRLMPDGSDAAWRAQLGQALPSSASSTPELKPAAGIVVGKAAGPANSVHYGSTAHAAGTPAAYSTTTTTAQVNNSL